MNIKLYYFSGTGNSFATAKYISRKLNADLISIPKVMGADKIHIDADDIGIIFPSYLAHLSGLPLMVERFVKKVDNIKSLNIFAVCTCGGYETVNAVPSLKKLKRIINSCGGKLSAEFSVRLPMNNLDYDHIPVPISSDPEVIIKNSLPKIDDISCRILMRKGSKNKLLKSLFYLIMIPFYKLMHKSILKTLMEKAEISGETNSSYYDLIPMTDKSISLNQNCNGCGICVKVCPSKNINIIDARPEFQHRCEMCFAQWCLITQFITGAEVKV